MAMDPITITPAPDDDHPATIPALTELLELLRELDAVRSADMDPSQLNLPGVWVQLRGIDHGAALDGHARLQLALHLIVPNTDGGIRAMVEAATLYNAVCGDGGPIEPDGPVTTTVVAMPDSTDYPALVVPIDLDA